MDKLSTYLAAAKITSAEFAVKVGTSKGYMHDLLNARRVPSIRLAAIIENKSNGAVPVSSWAMNLDSRRATQTEGAA